MSKLTIGCCGFAIGRKNYYRHFSCVEVQQTFYHPPNLETLARWRGEAPEWFEFTIKAWQLITHPPQSPTYRRLRMDIPAEKSDCYGLFRPSDELWAAWEIMIKVAEALDSRIIVFQSPPSFVPSAENRAHMDEFFQRIERGEFVLAWEPRGWREEEASNICQKLDLIHVVDPLKASPLWGNMTYYRLHGRDGYRYRYTDNDLLSLRKLVPGGSTAYVMFNNTSMFQDGLRFKQMCERGEDADA